MVVKQGDVISYLWMCTEEGVNLRRGMNFRLKKKRSVILMSLRPDAAYADRVEDEGRVLIYEGHDVGRGLGVNPKSVDQPLAYPNGRPTANALFFEAAESRSKNEAELVKVYEKIKPSIWVYNGLFHLIDAWKETSNGRQVFKFKLEMTAAQITAKLTELDHTQ